MIVGPLPQTSLVAGLVLKAWIVVSSQRVYILLSMFFR